MTTTLDNLLWDAKHKEGTYALTDKQKADILAMIGKRCRQTTVDRLARRLELPLSLWQRFGIYSRLTLDDNGADYICGQSWLDEMRTLRQCILK
jgi:hypothetical protein